ncbi:MAG: hypothetical protein ABI417_03245 [Coleofasciculaceae cyanobacterium]
MNKIVAVILTCVTVPASIFFSQPAKADIGTYCYPVGRAEVLRDSADHPGAYRDGYSEGRQSKRSGDRYSPRTSGGEFARGFEDGYYGRRFVGQDIAIPNRVEYYASQQCNNYSTYNYFPYRPLFRGRYWNRPGLRW